MHSKRRWVHFIGVAFFFFMLGFFTHALFFPYLFTNTFILNKQSITPTEVPSEPNKSLTQVYYENGEFNPRVVQIKKSYYLGIINASDTELMWLTSENPLFRTPRGYGKSEELRTILYDEGVWEVSSKLHPEHKLQVIVKP